jgi:hypothetical protein
LALGLLALSLPPVYAEADKPAPPSEQKAAAPPQQEKLKPREAARREAERLAQAAGQKVKDFAGYADGYLERATEVPVYGWSALAAAALLGTLSLFFGWTFLQWLLVPCAPLLGLTTGGFTAFCVVQTLYTNRPAWFRMTLLGVGVAVGVGLYLFSALKAKPVAAFLVILSPFLMVAAFLFSYSAASGVTASAAIGLVIFCIGFAAGFAAMIEVRFLSIGATALLGAVSLVATWGLLSHLMHGQPQFLRDVFLWLLDNPLMLAIACGALAFVGICFQLATGPRGGLAE